VDVSRGVSHHALQRLLVDIVALSISRTADGDPLAALFDRVGDSDWISTASILSVAHDHDDGAPRETLLAAKK
jgi:hypothetical protein